MIEFTKEEISLCKQVAEKYEKKIVCGDWVYVTYPPQYSNPPQGTGCAGLYERIQNSTVPFKIEFVLWTISDCLEWLKERYDDVDLGSIQGKWDIQIHDAYDKVHHPEFFEDIRGKTPLEACLKAVLVVLENK